MSAQEPQVNAERSNRRRRPTGGNRRRGPRKTEGTEGETAAPRERRERPVSLPVPAELVGRNANGLVSTVVRRGRLRFGFISLGLEEKPDEESVRIYFSFDNLTEPDVILRRGYPVEFSILSDDKGRAFASGVTLTAAGKTVAANREVELAAAKAERAANGIPERVRAPRAPREEKPRVERAPREPREPKERVQREKKFVEPRLVVLKVTSANSSETKLIEFDLAQSIGKLKNVATTAFEAPVTYNVFHKNVFLTRAITGELKANDTIHLGEPVAV